jgi:hypothetical protein
MSVDLSPQTELGDSVIVTSQDILWYTACYLYPGKFREITLRFATIYSVKTILN